MADACARIARSLANSSQPEAGINENLAQIKEKSDIYARFWWELREISKTEELKRLEINEENIYEEEYSRELKNLFDELDIIQNHISSLSKLTCPSTLAQRLGFTTPLASNAPPTLPTPKSENIESRIKYFQNEVPAYVSKNIEYFHKEFVTTGCLLDYLEEFDKLIQTGECNSKLNTALCKIIEILQKIKSKKEHEQIHKDLISSVLDRIPKQLWIDFNHCEEIERDIKETAQISSIGADCGVKTMAIHHLNDDSLIGTVDTPALENIEPYWPTVTVSVN